MLFVLWHEHKTDFGDNEEKYIGTYSTKEKAHAAIERLTLQPGFKKYPDGFRVEPRELDQTSWSRKPAA
jgi:homoserine kinase type II